jgi:hypothetical protein
VTTPVGGLTALVTGRVRRARLVAARTMPGPLLVRLVVWVSGFVAVALPFPPDVLFDARGIAILLAVAALPAVGPQTRVVSVDWLAATTYYGETLTAWRLTVMAGALYLVHTGAALAAVLPYDTVVSPGVLGRWLLRTAAVIAATAVFATLALAGAGLLGDRTSVVAAVLGVAVVVPLGWLLARWSRR